MILFDLLRGGSDNKGMKKIIGLLLLCLVFSTRAFAASDSHFTYDLSGSSGTRDGASYSEVHLGLNWFMTDWFNWRNSIFTQFGTNIKSVSGLDSEALLKFDAYTQSRALGVEFYAGPGVRMASEQSNAVFGKAGVTLALGGLRIGGGVQALHYLEDRVDSNNNMLNKDEVQTFITLSGGGSF